MNTEKNRRRVFQRVIIFSAPLIILVLWIALKTGSENWAAEDFASPPKSDGNHRAIHHPKNFLKNPRTDPNYAPPRPSSGLIIPEGIVRPAEFEPMDGVIISVVDHGPEYMKMWSQMLEVFSRSGFVWIIANQEAQETLIDSMEQEISEDSYEFLDYPLDSIWIRDYGPEFVYAPDGTRHIIDGVIKGPYAFWPRDDAIPIEIGRDDWINADGSPMKVHTHLSPVTGGNIMTDGAGTCFVSNVIFGNEKPRRWTKKMVNAFVKKYYGCEQLIVLRPLCMESTGHIDLFAKIVDPTSILLGQFDPDTYFNGKRPTKGKGRCRRPNDYKDMEYNLGILESTTNLDGEPWTVVRIPMLEPFEINELWIYRSYLNAQILNDQIVMPAYYQERGNESREDLFSVEAEAVEAYEEAAPNLEITPIQADAVVEFGGAIHCICHEIPVENPYEDDMTTTGDKFEEDETETESEDDAQNDNTAEDDDTGDSDDDSISSSQSHDDDSAEDDDEDDEQGPEAPADTDGE